MTSGAIPGMSGFQLVEDHGVAQRYDAVDGHGRPVTLVMLGDAAAQDPRLRELFATHSAQAATAALPGELQVTFDSAAARPWAASYQQVGSAGAERMLPGFVAAATTWPVPAPSVQPPPPPQDLWAPVTGAPVTPPGLPTAPPAGVQWDPVTQQWVQQTSWGTPQAPAGWGQPPAPRQHAALITIIAVVVVLLISAGVLVAFLASGDDDDSPSAAPGGSDQLIPPDQGLELPDLPLPPKLEGPAPELKDVPPTSIVGPNWGAGEQTQTLAFDGWPFAFRAPPTWGCILGSYDRAPDAYIFSCIDEQNPTDRQRSNIFLRKCPTTCTPDEQRSMNEDWLDEPERAVQKDPTTVYVETPVNERGLYSIDASHFFAERPGEPLKWQIGVYVESPPETRDEVLKMLNDIRSQTP